MTILTPPCSAVRSLAKVEGFTQKVYAVFGKLYQQQAGAAGDPMNGAGPQPGTTNDDGSVNADGSVE